MVAPGGTVPVEQAAINLAVAVVLGSAIGFERQWRHRLAGLRTNTLVALGAASFVVFEALVPNESSPTRVAAQVVSGVGFLGAGVIFREGYIRALLCRAWRLLRATACDRHDISDLKFGGCWLMKLTIGRNSRFTNTTNAVGIAAYPT